MDIRNKLAYATQHVTGIARHDDAPLEVRNAALDRLVELIGEERVAASARVQEKVQAALAPLDAE